VAVPVALAEFERQRLDPNAGKLFEQTKKARSRIALKTNVF